MAYRVLVSSETDNSKNFINSIARGFEVIRCFGPGREAMTLSEVAEVTGLNRATSRRILLTLEALEYVTQEKRRFRLTSKVLDLGYAFLSSNRLLEIAQSHLQVAGQRSGETASMAVLSGTEVIYNARVPNARLVSSTISIGTRLPAAATAIGRVLLAQLEKDKIEEVLENSNLRLFTPHTVIQKNALRQILDHVFHQGHCFVKDELEIDLSAVAVPVFDRAGHVVASISFDGPTSRLSDPERRENYLAILLEASRRITQDLNS